MGQRTRRIGINIGGDGLVENDDAGLHGPVDPGIPDDQVPPNRQRRNVGRLRENQDGQDHMDGTLPPEWANAERRRAIGSQIAQFASARSWPCDGKQHDEHEQGD